ncbi:MAG: hypothetical protein ACRCYE_10835 [Sarcina sp.]
MWQVSYRIKKGFSILLSLSIQRKRLENKIVANISRVDSLENIEVEKFMFLENIKLNKAKDSYLKFYYLNSDINF